MLTRTILSGSPFQAMTEMERLFDSLVGAATRPASDGSGTWTYPAVNLWEDDTQFVAEMELPGLRLEDLDVTVLDDQLTVKGQRAPIAHENARPLRRERAMGEFERTVTLPAAVDADKAEATLKDGVLTIALPKQAAAQSHRIAVKAAPAGS